MKRDLATRALKMAVAPRRRPKGCIHDTDGGSQYCSHCFQKLRRQHGIKVSMSVKGSRYDNSTAETFFKTINAELIWRRPWRARRDAEMTIFQYINGLLQSAPKKLSIGLEKPSRIRTESGPKEHLGRHERGQIHTRRNAVPATGKIISQRSAAGSSDLRCTTTRCAALVRY